MTSIGLLLELDDRIDELRGMIHVQQQRIAQTELEGRDPTNARKALDVLERHLKEAASQRDQVSRELEQQRHLEIKSLAPRRCLDLNPAASKPPRDQAS